LKYSNYILSLKMEAVYSSETSVNVYRTTWRHIPEDSIRSSFFLFEYLTEISNNNSIQIYIYLRAELNSQWPIKESAQMQTATSVGQYGTKHRQ
jgi:hypothetical protein